MRHRVGHRKLGRVTEHRIAMLRGQALAVLRHGSIRTTLPKAKELRPFVERLITIAKRGNAGGADGRALQARRLVLRDIHDQTVVAHLFDTIAPRYVDRPGGYTRILRLGYRRGDSAEVAQLELLGSEYHAKLAAEKAAAEGSKPKAKGVGGRLRAAAERLRARGEENKPEDGKGKSGMAGGTPGKARQAKRAPGKKGGG
jgi:large subunit ribosomal protein L17